jgi:MFS family permease
MGLGSFGLLLCAAVASPLTKRFGVGPMIVASMFINGPGIITIALMPPDPLVAGGAAPRLGVVTGLGAIIYNVNQVSFRQAIKPLEMRGRMNATMRLVVRGVMPVGSLAEGLLASLLPIRTTILIGAVIGSTAFLWVLISPVRSLREMPTGEAARG